MHARKWYFKRIIAIHVEQDDNSILYILWKLKHIKSYGFIQQKESNLVSRKSVYCIDINCRLVYIIALFAVAFRIDSMSNNCTR